MEYVLYAEINGTLSKISEKVLDILKRDCTFGEVGGIKVGHNEMCCYCDVFTLCIDNISDTIKCIAEESKQSVNIEFYMDLNTKCENVVAKTIYFVGKLMQGFLGNVVLMQNGDTPIVMRSGENVIVDKTKVPYFYPFEMLGMEYEVNRINF